MSEDKNNNNQKPEDLMPDWMVNLFKPGNRLCHNCEKDLTLDDLFGIELYCTSVNDGIKNGPKAGVSAYCSRCDLTIRFTLSLDLINLLQGVEGLYTYLAQDRMNGDVPSPTLPSPNTDPEIPLYECDEGDDDGPGGTAVDVPSRFTGQFGDDIHDNPIEAAFRKRRRKRYKNLIKPISDAEVQTFLNQMQRASFKRSTKSYRQFIEKFGIDIDKDYSAEGGDQ